MRAQFQYLTSAVHDIVKAAVDMVELHTTVKELQDSVSSLELIIIQLCKIRMLTDVSKVEAWVL